MKILLALSLAAAIGVPSCEFPVPQPTPSPTATPTATATPTPSPTPAPSPSPTALPTAFPTPTQAVFCNLPPSTAQACLEKPDFDSEFAAEIGVIQEAIEKDYVLDGKVKDPKAYLDEVARRLRLVGLCAINGFNGGHTSQDEVWVKDTNAFSDHFDLIRSDGAPIRLFAARCTKAQF